MITRVATKMVAVTNHAALRFVQRVMNLDVDGLTKKQETAAKAKILSTLEGLYDQIQKLSRGHFRVGGNEYIVVANVVVTVATDPREGSQGAFLRGGIMRSGSKHKKLQQISHYDRKDNYV